MSHGKLISMEAENVKRLRFVRIKFCDGVMIVGGQNGEGKTSVLDAIAMALGGNKLVPEKPIRDGAAKGSVSVDLGDLRATRTFTKSGSTLEVTDSSGKVSSPQAILDKLVGKLTLDPLDFYRQKPAAQHETLRNIVGIDFAPLEAQRADLYAERAGVNKEVSALRILVEAAPRHAGAPPASLSSADVVAELEAAMAANAANGSARLEAEQRRRLVSEAESKSAEASARVERLRAELVAAEEAQRVAAAGVQTANAAATEAEVEVQILTDVDVAPIQEKLRSLETINAQVAANARAATLEGQLREAQERSAALTDKIADIDRDKERQLSAAKFPVDGLSLDDAGVLYRGIPLVQCSAAEQLRTAVSLAFAMNPTIKIALVRDGSLLDDRSMEILEQMAAQHEAQVIVERVGKTGHVVLEDGMVQTPAAGALSLAQGVE